MLKRKFLKSEVYENADYIVTVRDIGDFGVAPPQYRDEESDKILYSFYIVTIKNKHTGKQTQKRMYQGDPIYFLESWAGNNYTAT